MLIFTENQRYNIIPIVLITIHHYANATPQISIYVEIVRYESQHLLYGFSTLRVYTWRLLSLHADASGQAEMTFVFN